MFDNYRWTEQKAAESEWGAMVEPAVAMAIASDGGEVRIIEAQARNILKTGAVEIIAVAVVNYTALISSVNDGRADSRTGRSYYVAANMGWSGTGPRNYRGYTACRRGSSACAAMLGSSEGRKGQRQDKWSEESTAYRTLYHG